MAKKTVVPASTFPKEVFVRWEEDGGSRFLITEESAEDAVGSEGPRFVATYQLIKVEKLALQQTVVRVS